MKKLILIPILLTVLSFTPTHCQAQLRELHYLTSLADKGIRLLRSLFWDDCGILSVTTDRKQGVYLEIDGKDYGSVYPGRHANFEIKEGVYLIRAYDRRRPNRIWEERIRIKADILAEVTLSKGRWLRKNRHFDELR